MKKGEPVDILYLYLAKVFNKVPTRKFFGKMKVHGIDRKILCWIEIFW